MISWSRSVLYLEIQLLKFSVPFPHSLIVQHSELISEDIFAVYTQVCRGSHRLVDPSLTEEERVREEEEGGAGGHVTVVYLSSLDEVTAIKQNGCMLPDDLMTVRKILWEKYYIPAA